jgi:hypothetical protein
LLEEKIPFSQAKKFFKIFITYKKNFILLWDFYYTFLFEDYLLNNDKYWFYKKDLEQNSLDLNKIIFYFDWKNFAFVKNYKKEKLVSKKFLQDIKNKEKFLEILSWDVKKIPWYYEKYLEELKKLTKELLKNSVSKEEKIEKIYNYIINNLVYFTWNYNKNKEVFSGILTFKNKIWICEWYVKLFSYMALFWWINDIEIIKGYVFNSKDFPNVWHAWLKIWNLYYDPTFDDPIGNKWNIKKQDYLYFALEKDLFYTNRFNFWEKEKFEKYKNLSLEDREKIVEKNLFEKIWKYKWKNLLKFLDLKLKLWFKAGEKITIEKLKNKIKFIKVDKNFNFIDKTWKKRLMKKIEYFNINEKNIEILLKQVWEKIFNSYILEKNNKFYLAITFEYK